MGSVGSGRECVGIEGGEWGSRVSGWSEWGVCGVSVGCVG